MIQIPILISFWISSIFHLNLALAEKTTSQPKAPISQKNNSAITTTSAEEVLDNTERNRKYRETLKKNWLIPMSKGEYERLSRRFKGLALFDTERRPWVIPGITLVTPSGYSAQWGDVFWGFSVNDRTRFGRIADAYAAIGFGLGDPIKWLGFEVILGFLNVRKIFNSGKGLSAKVSHTFPDGTSIAIGKIDFLQWPKNSADTGSSEYIALSRAFQLEYDPRKPFSLLVVNIGIGDGQFKSDEKFKSLEPGVGLFSSISLRVIEPVSLIANWNHNLHLGASIAPFRRFPLLLTLGVLDTLKTQGDGLRYVVSISYSDSVFSRTFPVDWFRGEKL